jgi:hypothetical protein|tara:strand:- start:89 stop:427 length:339 start_codon:yes stop_codon:yes gene_type:complete
MGNDAKTTGNRKMALDENDPRYIEIDKRLHAVIAKLDDDFLEGITNAEWDGHVRESYHYNAALQMIYAIVESYGVSVAEFFVDWSIEPHNIYLLPEYKRRRESVIDGKPKPS